MYGLVARYGPQVSCQRKLVSHARREFFRPKIAIFSQFSVYLSITQAKQIINLLLLSNFYPVTYRQIQETRQIVDVRFGHSLWSAISASS